MARDGLGNRWGETNSEADWKPGNVAFAYFAAGGARFRAQWKVALEGWGGESPIIQGFSILSARREMIQLFPTVGWPIGPAVAELGLRVPLAGRNLPTGLAVVLGYFPRPSF